MRYYCMILVPVLNLRIQWPKSSFLFLKTVFCVDDRSTRREKHERADTSWGAGRLRGPCHEGETTLISAIFGPTVKCLADTQTNADLLSLLPPPICLPLT